ncbi:secretory granule protein t2-a, putative, partial [Ichthyophthirius multifiliis]
KFQKRNKKKINKQIKKKKIIMNKTAFFIALFIILTSAIKLEQVNTQLKQIEKTKFGKNLLDMIQLSLTTSEHIDDLVFELKNLDNDLVKEQSDDDSENKRIGAECEEEVARLTQEISEAKQKSSELQSEINAKTPVQLQKQILLKENESQKVEYQKSIVDLDAFKEEVDKLWATVQDDHQKATYTIQRAKDVIVGEFQKGSAFLQRKDINFVQLSKHFSDSARHNNFQKKSWNKLFKVLSQITASAPVQADSGAIQKIVELCDELLSKLDESLLQERQNYNHQVAVYHDEREAAVQHLQETQLHIDNLTAEIHTLKSRIEQCENEKTSQDERAVEKEEELSKRNIYCFDQQEQYKLRSQQRDEQLKIVREVLDIINSQLRVLKKYVGDRTD